MGKAKISPEELNAESLRLSALINKRSEAGSKAVAERAKTAYTYDQMRAQCIRHNLEASWVWENGYAIPDALEAQIQAQIKAEGLDPARPYNEDRDGGLLIPDTAT